MLSWLFPPIEPSPFACLGPPLLALLALACAGTAALLGPARPPDGFSGPLWLSFGLIAWVVAAVRFVRRRRAGRPGLGIPVSTGILGGAALLIMQVPTL